MNDKKTAISKDGIKGKKQISRPIRLESDGLFKSIMEDKIAAKEFLEEYLPISLQSILDLNKITIEKESYIEDDLKKKFSNVVYSVEIKKTARESEKHKEKQVEEHLYAVEEYKKESAHEKEYESEKEHEKAFIYILLEHQSKPDYWMALRLWKYTLLLCERHKQQHRHKHVKLPLIVPMVFYNGKEKNATPKSLWQLFGNPGIAEQLMGDEYTLVDLQAKTDDEIKHTRHLSLMEFFLKHIHERDMLKLWERFLSEFKGAVMIDKENGYIYIKKLLWYTNTKVAENDKGKLNQLIINSLANKDGEDIMRTIADSYRDQYYEAGIEQGIQEGIERGVEKGIERGRKEGVEKGIEKTAINMLKQNLDFKLIASVTGLSSDEILKLKNNS